MLRSRLAPLVVLPALLLTGCSFSFSVGGGESASPTPVTVDTPAPSPEASAPSPETSAPGATAEATPESIAEATEDRLEEMVGSRPFVDCGSDPVVVEVNGTHLCTLMAEGDDARYDVTVTFTALAEDGSFDFDFQVADEPR